MYARYARGNVVSVKLQYPRDSLIMQITDVYCEMPISNHIEMRERRRKPKWSAQSELRVAVREAGGGGGRRASLAL